MSAMAGYLLDTSIFVAFEQDRDLAAAPEGEARISVATLTELGIGVRRSREADLEVRRATLARARQFVPIAYDEYVADRLAGLLAAARELGRRASAFDAIVAATALVHDLSVYTQDADFDVLAELAPDLRVHRG